MNHGLIALSLLALCAGAPGPARAATVIPALLPYTATAHATGIDNPAAYSAETATNSAGSVYPDGRAASGQSYAGPGGIGFAGMAFVPARDPADDFDGVLGGESMSGSGGGHLRFDDLVFSGTAGDGAVQAVVSTIFHLSGWMSFDRVIGANSSARASVSVRYALDTPGLPQNIGSVRRESDRSSLLFRNDGVFASLGDDTSLTLSGTFRTPPQVVPLDRPLLFRMEVGGGASAVARDETAVTATMDFLSTFRLGPDGPIFDLPEGITANSVKAGIVNNRFALPGATPIPVPPGLALLLSALTVLSLPGWLWRKGPRVANQVGSASPAESSRRCRAIPATEMKFQLG
jgi:hypothetical protein